MRSKKEVKALIKEKLAVVDEFLTINDGDDEKLIGRIVKLTPEVDKGNFESMLELIIMQLFLEDVE